MKYIYLLLTVFIISACSKEDLGPMGLKHGQEVEVIIDHRYGAEDHPLLLPNRTPSEYLVHGFNERVPGHTYKINYMMKINFPEN